MFKPGKAVLFFVSIGLVTAFLAGCGGRSRRRPASAEAERPPESQEKLTSWERGVRYRELVEKEELNTLQQETSRRIAADPKDDEAHFYYARSLSGLGKFPASLKHFEKAIELKPQNRTYSRVMAEELDKAAQRAIQADDPQTAVDYWKRAMGLQHRPRQTEKSLAEAFRRLGEKESQSGNHAAAEAAFRDAIHLLPDNPVSRLDLARLMVSRDRLMEAQREYRDLVRIHPTYEAGLLGYASLMRRTGDVRGSTELVERVLRVSPDNPEAIALQQDLKNEVPIALLSSDQEDSGLEIPDQTLIQRLSILEGSDNLQGQVDLLRNHLRQNPGASWAKLRLAMVYERMGRSNEGLLLINDYLNQRPDDIRAQFMRARFLQLTGNLDGALIVLRALEAEQNANLQVFDEMGQVFAKMGRFDEATTYWNRVLDADPDYSSVLFNFGQLAMEKGDFQKARDFFGRAINKEPFNLKFRFFAGLNLSQAGFPDEARTLWEGARSFLNPSDDYGARIMRALGEEPPVRETAMLAVSPPGLSTQDLTPAITIRDLAQPPRAIQPDQSYESLRQRQEPDYYIALEYARSGMFNEALLGFKNVLARNPANFNALMNLGNVYRALENPAMAATQYLLAIRVSPTNIHALRSLAQTYNELGLHPYAAGIRDRVRRENPDKLEGFPVYPANEPPPRTNPRAFKPMIDSLNSSGLESEALALIQSGITEHPDRPDLVILEGEVFMNQRNFQAAEASFRKAMEFERNNPLPYIRLGDLYVRQNLLTQASGFYRSALKTTDLDPDSMFEIADRFQSIGSTVEANRVLNRLKVMNLSQAHVEQLNARLGGS